MRRHPSLNTRRRWWSIVKRKGQVVAPTTIIATAHVKLAVAVTVAVMIPIAITVKVMVPLHLRIRRRNNHHPPDHTQAQK